MSVQPLGHPGRDNSGKWRRKVSEGGELVVHRDAEVPETYRRDRFFPLPGPDTPGRSAMILRSRSGRDRQFCDDRVRLQRASDRRCIPLGVFFQQTHELFFAEVRD